MTHHSGQVRRPFHLPDYLNSAKALGFESEVDRFVGLHRNIVSLPEGLSTVDLAVHSAIGLCQKTHSEADTGYLAEGAEQCTKKRDRGGKGQVGEGTWVFAQGRSEADCGGPTNIKYLP